MGLSAADLHAINARLVPLMAHDRAGFGGCVATTGLVAALCLWCAPPSPSLRQAVGLAGALGFGTAIAIHPVVGYNDLVHVGPALLAAALLGLGFALLSLGREHRRARAC